MAHPFVDGDGLEFSNDERRLPPFPVSSQSETGGFSEVGLTCELAQGQIPPVFVGRLSSTWTKPPEWRSPTLSTVAREGRGRQATRRLAGTLLGPLAQTTQ